MLSCIEFETELFVTGTLTRKYIGTTNKGDSVIWRLSSLTYLHIYYIYFFLLFRLLGAVRLVFPVSSEFQIAQKIGTYLAQAGDRDGGRRSRTVKPPVGETENYNNLVIKRIKTNSTIQVCMHCMYNNLNMFIIFGLGHMFQSVRIL